MSLEHLQSITQFLQWFYQTLLIKNIAEYDLIMLKLPSCLLAYLIFTRLQQHFFFFFVFINSPPQQISVLLNFWMTSHQCCIKGKQWRTVQFLAHLHCLTIASVILNQVIFQTDGLTSQDHLSATLLASSCSPSPTYVSPPSLTTWTPTVHSHSSGVKPGAERCCPD